ncbi:MAG: polysaccharide deacetylase family protein [Flavihumibacter sp.]
MKYWKTGNLLLRAMYPRRLWQMDGKEKKIYLTFDDGPHPEITPWVLALLRQYHAKASFFCIGKNVLAYPQVYAQLLAESHVTGNHTMHHVNGWKTANNDYLTNVAECSKWVNSRLFRPPYGKLTHAQSRLLQKQGYRVVMWSVLSGDFDHTISGADCWENVQNNTRGGSVVVFHDSEKAFDRLSYTLPRLLEKFTKEGYRFEALRIE